MAEAAIPILVGTAAFFRVLLCGEGKRAPRKHGISPIRANRRIGYVEQRIASLIDLVS